MTGDLFLVAEIGGRTVAVPAADVASVSELEKTTAVPGAPEWIEGIGTQRSRALTVIDACKAIGIEGPDDGQVPDARCIVFVCEGHQYALRCDRILDVTPAESLSGEAPKGLGALWLTATAGVVETAFGPALRLDLPACVAGPDRIAA
ncbi:chemotaxis protein CheW [Erythrobacter litoralis]|uniref:CheW-like domain-containing protein n=1 Tax=Erythrobacter litoralis (strain HTCC2594) TaxID=314225 RepID=Q2N7J7_ERYLH|nr:chemotaxis protein CheW [Erythrobacter litoralis]ABC64344.1 hypothetical protein ELI_11260 [Erythrobacter litoralis HTCC2594]